MRKFTEPTARNLLRKPMVLGVPFSGLLALSFVTLIVFVASGSGVRGNIASVLVGAIGYVLLRVFNRFARAGWEEALLFPLERCFQAKASKAELKVEPSAIAVLAPDTFTEADLLTSKDQLLERIVGLRASESFVVAFDSAECGARLWEVQAKPGRFESDLLEFTHGLVAEKDHVYSLHALPVVTDPLWFFGLLSKLPKSVRVIVRVQGLNASGIKSRIEHSRRLNSRGVTQLSQIDSDITFEEASSVLEGISRGSESVVELAVVVVSDEPLALDPTHFCEEKTPSLSVLSVLGVRRRFHRSHIVRSVTASDLIPNVSDPYEEGLPAILQTPRSFPLYFSPQDARLEALHWVVSGASGSGKSFFTGLVLKRMLEVGTPMSVLFVDHNRSFRRFVRSEGEPYLEPTSLKSVEQGAAELYEKWNTVGSISGLELSDLDLSEKKVAIHALLSRVETFLRFRDTTHPFYLVLDECWNFMRDEPVMVQRAFREFRKLNGAVIAITQSLSDFLTDESGQSIFQNAPIRILLRQGEDIGQYQGILGLNSVEAAKVSRLKQSRGVYSECLIKTPFLSRFGRLYPTDAEHSLLRTDNLRAELISEFKKTGGAQCLSV